MCRLAENAATLFLRSFTHSSLSTCIRRLATNMASLRDDCLPALHVWQSLTCADTRGGRRAAIPDAAADALSALPFSARLSKAATASIVADALDAIDGDEAAALGRLRARLDGVGVRLASAAVQWHRLTVQRRSAAASGHAERQLPSLLDPVRDSVVAVTACVGRRNAPTIPALSRTAGVLRPRTLTLLLGPPGAGKTTLLRVLSGRLQAGGGVSVSGSIRLNGVDVLGGAASSSSSSSACSWPRTVAYGGVADAHLPTLTVSETLRFAEACSGGDPVTRDAVATLIAADASESTPIHPADAALDRVAAAVTNPANGAVTEWVLRVLRLAPAAHTIVGDAMLRGVSGGERRRLSTAELLVGAARVLCLNSVSTGLDTGATLALASSLRSSADTLDVAALVSLLAPEPDAVALFDDVLLLAHGRVLYHGPIDAARRYFEGVGKTLPPLAPGTSVADHLLALAAAASPDDANRLAGAWEASEPGRALAAAAAGPPPPGSGTPSDFCHPGFAAPFPHLVALCLRRCIKVDVKRSAASYAIRWGLALAMSAILGSLFLSRPLTVVGGQARLAALFFMLFFLLTLAVPVVEQTFERRPIILRHRDDGLYPGAAELVAQALVAVPVSIIDAACAALPLASLASIAPDPTHRAALVAVFALLSVGIDALYRAFGAAFSALNNGIAVGVVLLLGLQMTAGFTLSAASIPPWWRWLHYANPMAWAWRTLAILEMTGERWRDGDVGATVLATFDVPASAAWAWWGVAFWLASGRQP